MFKFLKMINLFLEKHQKKFILLLIVLTVVFYAFQMKQYFTNDVDDVFLVDDLYSSAPIQMDLEINLPKQADDIQNITFKIKNIFFSVPNIDSNVDKICIDSISMLFSGFSTFISPPFENRPYHFDYELCGQVEPFSLENEVYSYYATLYDFTDNLIEITDRLYSENNPFYFPFDWFQLQVAAIASVKYVDDSGNILEQQPFQISIFTNVIDAGEWEATSKDVPDVYFWDYWNDGLSQNGDVIIIEEQYAPIIQNSPSVPQILKFISPIYLKLLFFVIIIALVTFILILSITDSLEIFLTGSIAILFGMFTTRSIFFPETNDTKTIIDVVYIGIYVAFATIVISQGYSFISNQMKSNVQNRPIMRHITKKIDGLKRPSRIPLKKRTYRRVSFIRNLLVQRKKDK